MYNADTVIDIDNIIITVLAFSAEDKNTPLSRRYKENKRCGAKKLLKVFPNQRLTFWGPKKLICKICATGSFAH